MKFGHIMLFLPSGNVVQIQSFACQTTGPRTSAAYVQFFGLLSNDRSVLQLQ